MPAESDNRIRVDLLKFGVATLKRICPEFNEEIAKDMEEAYWADPEFIGTPYEHQPRLIKAYHLHKELNYLAERL
jgi:hypothetical protein